MAYYDPINQDDPRNPKGTRRQGVSPAYPAASPSLTVTGPSAPRTPQTQQPSPDFTQPASPAPGENRPDTSIAPAPPPAAPFRDPTQRARAGMGTGRPMPGQDGWMPPTQDLDMSGLPGRRPTPAPPADSGTAPTTPTAPIEPADPWTAPPPDGDWRSWFLQNTQGLPPTPNTLVALESKLAQHGIKVHRNASGTAGKIIMPDGRIIDVIFAAGEGGKGWQWLTPEQQGGSPLSAPMSAYGGDLQGGGAAPTLGSITSNLSAAGLTAFQEQMRQMILQQLAGASQPVDESDPSIRQPINAAGRQAESIRRRRQAADAERLTQQGLGDSGALDTARRQGFEDMSQTVSGVTAQVIGEAMNTKKREFITLLQTAMASGDAQAARQVQMQLAAIDAELRRLGLSQQHSQFMTDADLRRQGLSQQQGQFDSSLDLDWARHHAGLL